MIFSRYAMTLSLTLALAFAFSAFSALHGLDTDQMILYQAGLKLLSGQVLYRDFYLPHGPLGTLTLAFFLALFPTGGYALVFASGLLNAGATYCVWDIVRRNTTELFYPILASVLTAIWFLPVFGSVYYDHLAYFFVLLSFVFLSREDKGFVFSILAALSLVIAFHYKQTVGLPGLIALGLSGKSKLKRNFYLSYFLCHLFVLVGIAIFTDISSYFLYTFKYPLQHYFSGESTKSVLNLITIFLLPYGINPAAMLYEKGLGRLAFYPVILVFYSSYWVLFRYKLGHEKRQALTFLVLSTLLCSCLLGRLFAHLFFGAGGVFALTFSSISIQRKTLCASLCAGGLSLLGVLYVNQLRPFSLKVEHYFSHTDLAPIQVELSPLSYAAKEVLSYLHKNKGELGLLTDLGYLVPLAQRQATWNLSVIYHEGLTVPLSQPERTDWEKASIEKLDEHNVEYILATVPISNAFRKSRPETLPLPVPMLEDHLKRKFELVLSQDIFSLYKRKN